MFENNIQGESQTIAYKIAVNNYWFQMALFIMRLKTIVVKSKK